MFENQVLYAGSEFLLSHEAPRCFQLLQALHAVLHAALTVDLVVTGTDIHRLTRLFLFSHNFNRATETERQENGSIIIDTLRGLI